MQERARRIASLASGPNPPTRQELAEEFGISPRQVNNLIEHVEGMLGCEVVTRRRDSDGKMAYVVQAGDLLKLDMSVSEAIASVHITQSVLGTPLSGDDDAAGKAVGRLEAALAEAVRGKLRKLEGRFAIRILQAAKPQRPEAFRTVLDGLLENRVLHMSYESPYKAGARAAAGAAGKARKVETVTVEPYGVFFAKRGWYLVANKRPGQGMRQYKLARIRQVALGEQSFALPPGPYDLTVCVAGYRPQPLRGDDARAELRLDPWPEAELRLAEPPQLPSGCAAEVRLVATAADGAPFATSHGPAGLGGIARLADMWTPLVAGVARVRIGDGPHAVELALRGPNAPEGTFARVHLDGARPATIAWTGEPVVVTVPAAAWQAAIAAVTKSATGAGGDK